MLTNDNQPIHPSAYLGVGGEYRLDFTRDTRDRRIGTQSFFDATSSWCPSVRFLGFAPRREATDPRMRCIATSSSCARVCICPCYKSEETTPTPNRTSLCCSAARAARQSDLEGGPSESAFGASSVLKRFVGATHTRRTVVGGSAHAIISPSRLKPYEDCIHLD
ncbi:hypothetical protein MRX96_024290 [Rhipicephalus microplus]